LPCPRSHISMDSSFLEHPYTYLPHLKISPLL
jgi:hypothetical protein